MGILPKTRLERLVMEQIRSRVLTDDNLEHLVTMVNDELQSVSSLLKDRLDVIAADLRETQEAYQGYGLPPGSDILLKFWMGFA